MTPLRVTARIRGDIALSGGLEIDALLMAIAAREAGHGPALFGTREIPIPIARSECGRVYLCSTGIYAAEQSRLHRVVKRPVLTEKMRFNCRGRMNDSSGEDKAWMLPVQVHTLEDDRIDWWAIGDAERIRDLLVHVTHLGRKRAHGFGEVVAWSVEKCEPWAKGFPVVHAGKPTRLLPPDYPGLVEPRLAYRVPSPPYWERHRSELCAVPAGM